MNRSIVRFDCGYDAEDAEIDDTKSGIGVWEPFILFRLTGGCSADLSTCPAALHNIYN